ncbi:Myosin [Ecytonucleospora hepatopenaei]|uniref:Myosin n=1 Tax=Ecytonucleospora hepatopenaei TaxID=646526 RepID=A0A1W0E4H9_9MICR|nr:Myosin [Ecytonucleospora hepatopenaei]
MAVRRRTSNVFTCFNDEQISEMRDAFGLFDIDGDCVVTEENLKEFCKSIGDPFTDEEIKAMIGEISPNCNFMMFLSVLGDKLSQVSELQKILTNFKVLDEGNKGTINKEYLRKVLSETEDKEFEDLVKGCVKNGEVDYNRLAIKIKHGEILENLLVQEE